MSNRLPRRRAVARVGTLCVALLLAGGAAAAADAVPVHPAQASVPRLDSAAFDRAVDTVREHYGVPGLAVGIVREGEVVYARSVGEAVAGSGIAVDGRTIFKIASNSKAFTTALLGRLVDQGKLDWRDPVLRHRPAFRMADPWVTREMQVRDLLIHHSGLRPFAGDLMLWPEPNSFSRADIEAGLAHLPLVSSFRSEYAYDNVLYLLAGEVAAAAGVASYETLLERELFAPLGLSRCRAGAWSRLDDRNVAQPHQRVDGTTRVVRADPARIEPSTSNAAGGLRCSLDDLLRWSAFWLDENDARLSPASRAAIWAPHIALPLSDRQRRWDDAHFHAYGYGWRLSDMDGQLKVAHTGTLAGAMSFIVLLPELDVGVVLLMNLDEEAARQVLMQVMVKAFTAPAEGVTAESLIADWEASARAAEAAAVAAASPPAAAEGAARLPEPPARRAATPADLRSQLGVYRSPWFGEVRVCADGDGVRVASAKSPRVQGAVWRVGEGDADATLHLVFDDASVGGDVRLAFETVPDAASATSPATMLRFAALDPADDNGFEDLALIREGDCASAATPAPPPLSPARNAAEAGMIRLRELAPGVVHDLRYATSRNRAVRAFVAWAKTPGDRTKAEYYPTLEKSALVPDYIAEHSGHSRGATVDVALLDCRGAACTPVDMGTPFDFFGPEAHTEAPQPAAVRDARQRLLAAMAAEGFVNYPLEWWHFSWRAGPVSHAAYGFDVE